MTFGQWLKQSMEKASLSRADIAKRSGYTHTYITNLLADENPSAKGGKAQPSRIAVKRICRAAEGNLDEALIAAGYAPSLENVIFNPYEKGGIVEQSVKNDDDIPDEIRQSIMAFNGEISEKDIYIIAEHIRFVESQRKKEDNRE